MIPDGRVPGYLGRVLDSDGDPVGTCFQVVPGILVTAWHVLDLIAAAIDGAQVQLDPLAAGDTFRATVLRTDPLHDLVVLGCDTPLPMVTGELTVADGMEIRAPTWAASLDN